MYQRHSISTTIHQRKIHSIVQKRFQKNVVLRIIPFCVYKTVLKMHLGRQTAYVVEVNSKVYSENSCPEG